MLQSLCLGTWACEIAPTRLLFICSRNDVLLKGYINVKSGFTFISLASNSQSFKICPDLFSSSVVQVQHSCGRACSMLLLWPSYPTIVTCGRFSPKLLLHIQSWTFSFGINQTWGFFRNKDFLVCHESFLWYCQSWPDQIPFMISPLAWRFIKCPFDVAFTGHAATVHQTAVQW